MNPSVILLPEEKQEAGKTLDTITPAIAEMIKRKDSGEIVIYFHEGKFKRAKKTVTV